MSDRRIAVAYSAGRDSTALLHATLVAAAEQGVAVLALHVHHGLSPHADAWLAHADAQCRRWARAGRPVEFMASRLEGRPEPGQSVEAWARAGRYAALRAMAAARGVSVVLLAHHRLDQAETFLLQALRGAGPRGLAGMPRSVERDGIRWERPWLDTPRAAIDAYLRRHRLRHVEDDSNVDPRFARNRLRLAVWPAFVGAFPDAEVALARASAWAAEASALQDEVAADDLRRLDLGPGLSIAPWRALSPARRGNALRAWVRAASGDAPGAATLQRLLDELTTRERGRWLLDAGELRLHRGALQWLATPSAPERPDDAPPATALAVLAPGRHPLPGWGGVLRVEPVAEGGVPLAWLAHAELRARRGGERFQAGIGRPPRSLKKQYQAAGVPAWARDGPLVWSGGQLVFVPGLGIDARVVGLPGQAMVALHWEARGRGPDDCH